MFPETFAARWIERLTNAGDVLLDPFCGRGTLPLQALLMKRRAVGCDVNPVAYCVTRAKTNAPTLAAARRRITLLEDSFESDAWEAPRRAMPTFFLVAYRPEVLRQLLYLRAQLRWQKSDTDAMIAGVTLGVLHGETERSPSFLSNQMPHTISTKPEYSVRFWRRHGFEAPRRNVFELVRTQLAFRYGSEPPSGKGVALQMDMRDLPRVSHDLPRPIRAVITSPPYLDVTRFEEDQWLRLWFLGGPPYPAYGRVSKDDRHTTAEGYWGLIADFWRALGQVLARRSNIVVRIGAVRSRPEQLVRTLRGAAVASGRRVELVHHEITEIKKRQTVMLRPNARGCSVEVDCHFAMT
jgi:hypothetical protein